MKRGTKFGIITALTFMFTIFGAGVALAADEPTGDVFLDLFGQTSESCAAPGIGAQFDASLDAEVQNEAVPAGSLQIGTQGNAVMLSGNISENTALVVSDATPALLDAAGDVLKRGESVIWSGDIALASGSSYIPLKDAAQLSIYVGESYNGVALKLIHLKDDGTLEETSRVVRDGYITVITNSLSPFGVISDIETSVDALSDNSVGAQNPQPSAKPTVNAASSETLFPWLTPTPQPSTSAKPSEIVSQKPQSTTQPSKAPAADTKPAQTSAVEPSKTPAPTATKIPAVDSEPEITTNTQAQKPDASNKKPAVQAEEPGNEESKVTITDVPKTDDITDQPLPYLIYMTASVGGILVGVNLLQKPVKRKKPIK